MIGQTTEATDATLVCFAEPTDALPTNCHGATPEASAEALSSSTPVF